MNKKNNENLKSEDLKSEDLKSEDLKSEDLNNMSSENETFTDEDTQEIIDVSDVPVQDDGVDVLKEEKKKRNKPLKAFGLFCLALALAIFIFVPKANTVDKSPAAQQALTDGVSTSLSIGARLLSADETITQQDYTITHNYNEDSTKIWVWDYAAQDGDFVQVIVNGAPLGDAFMIKHTPVELTVPVVAEIQVKGVRDGGGGITYAIRYELNGTTYFNSTSEGEINIYTLLRE